MFAFLGKMGNYEFNFCVCTWLYVHGCTWLTLLLRSLNAIGEKTRNSQLLDSRIYKASYGMPFTRMRLTRVSTFENVFKPMRFRFAFSSFSCKREM